MTHVGPAPVSAVSTPGSSFVEWGAVLAGAVLAAAISFVLLTFGTAIGLSATSPWPNSGVSAKVIASIAVFWAMAQQIGAFMAGGYVAGRMRSRWHETGHEADFRDGLHGGLVWAVGVVLGVLLLWATAAKQCGSTLTRQCMVNQLSKVHDWTGGGLHAATDPGGNHGPDCGMLLRLQGSKYVQIYPAKAGTFDCSPSYTVKVTPTVKLNVDRIATNYLTATAILPQT